MTATPPPLLSTPLSKFLGMRHPIFLAGMNVAAGPELAAAVSNAGGCGVIGGVGYTPDFLRKQIAALKDGLVDQSLPFGVDLLLPKVGDGARATNKDYTNGELPELIDIIAGSGARLFVCAVGVPPDWAVSKLHSAGIAVMNMVGAPKHAEYALAAGVDIICAQGSEGGGHTGSIPTSLLIPAVVDVCAGKQSSFMKLPVAVVAAGGIYDGRGLAMSLCYGAQAVWVGTRFLCATEAGAPPFHQQAVLKAGYDDTVRTLIFTGRPLRVLKTPYIAEWEDRQQEIRQLCEKGTIPFMKDLEDKGAELMKQRPLLMGQVAGAIREIKPARAIVDEIMAGAMQALASASSFAAGVGGGGRSRL